MEWNGKCDEVLSHDSQNNLNCSYHTWDSILFRKNKQGIGGKAFQEAGSGSIQHYSNNPCRRKWRGLGFEPRCRLKQSFHRISKWRLTCLTRRDDDRLARSISHRQRKRWVWKQHVECQRDTVSLSESHKTILNASVRLCNTQSAFSMFGKHSTVRYSLALGRNGDEGIPTVCRLHYHVLNETYLGLASIGIDGNRFRFVKYRWEGFFQRKRGSAEISFQRCEKAYGRRTIARLTPFCKALP